MDKLSIQDRRTFLKGAAGTAIAAATVGLVGCSTSQNEDTSAASASPESTVAWDDEYDVIVVGAGAAGLTAALTVAREGDGASCLLLEKEASPNGNSPFCLGFSLYAEDADEVHEYLSQLIGHVTPDDMIQTFCEGLLENDDWILDLGANKDDIQFYKPYTTYPGEYPELPKAASVGMFTFTGAAGGYTHLQTFLFDKMTEQSEAITYMPSTALEELIQDPSSKAIQGVLANGKNYKANKGVIMCTGGFESDPGMVSDYLGVPTAIPLAGKSNTGDGHRACAKIGADFWHMYGGALFWMGCRDLENTKFLSQVWNFDNKKWGIVVGVNGRRFYMDWDGCAITPPSIGDDMTRNVGFRHGLTQFGGNWAHLSMPEKAWYVFDADGLANGAVPTDISTDPVGDNWAVTADTIEELAEKIEVPLDEFQTTVSTWNGFCDNGADLAFYRPVESLNKVAKAPFYAIRCSPAILNTDGGPRRNPEARILDPDGNPIPHLYSAGQFGSLWGHLYQGSGNIGECLVFGRIAARNALAE